MTFFSIARQIAPAVVGGTVLGLVVVFCSLFFEADMGKAVFGGDRTVAAHTTAWDYVPAAKMDKAQRLLANKDCDLPAGTIPGHAVVTVEGRTYLAPAQVGFDIWLGADGAADTGDEQAGTAHGFCR